MITDYGMYPKEHFKITVVDTYLFTLHNRLTCYAGIMPAFWGTDWDSILEKIVIFSKLLQDGAPRDSYYVY